MLQELRLKYDTDKEKNYLEVYERYFHVFKDKPVTLFEIGVLRAGSLLLWRDYFSKGKIIGLDINPVQLPRDSNRIRVFQGAQQDEELLKKISQEEAPGGFDIIIDDAAHVGSLARKSFEILFDQHLKPGGLYVIEDWGTGYWPAWSDGSSFEHRHYSGMVGFVKDLVDQCGIADITHPTRGSGEGLSPKIKGLYIAHGIVVIEKV